MADIKTLNDTFRQTFTGGRVMLTTGINAKSQDDIAKILSEVRQFNHFTKANDPYGEHDFGSFDYKSEKIFWRHPDKLEESKKSKAVCNLSFF